MSRIEKLKYSEYNGGDSLPAVHIGFEPEGTGLVLHVESYQLNDREETIRLLEAVVETLRDEQTITGPATVAEPTFQPTHQPFNPQPRSKRS